MKVFLSWSGERSKAVALALRNWLPLILHYADPWLSQQDIQAGDRWSVEVGNELNESHFGIICLTPENLTMPWILFEAGAISKSFSQGAVCPYLYGVDYSAVVGPLQQFQSKKADRPSTKELVESINSKSTTSVDAARLNTLFARLWPDLESQLSKIPSENLGLHQSRPQEEILEDLVQSVRAMEGKLRELSDKTTQYDEIIRAITRAEDDIYSMKFVIVADDQSVGKIKAGEKLTLQGSPSRLIAALASRAGLNSADYQSNWVLRDTTTDKSLDHYDILELSRKYRGQACTLKIENDIPF